MKEGKICSEPQIKDTAHPATEDRPQEQLSPKYSSWWLLSQGMKKQRKEHGYPTYSFLFLCFFFSFLMLYPIG